MKDSIRKCPRCGSEVRSTWTEGRMLQDYCYECGNDVGELYKPPIRAVGITKEYVAPQGRKWIYEIYDQYGHQAISSRSYDEREPCVTAAQKDLDRIHQNLPQYGTCSALIWPPAWIARAEVIGR